MRRILLLVAAAVALFTVSGCIDYEEVLTLNTDGSGTVEIHLVMDKTFMNEMQAMAEQFGGEPEGSSPAEEICSEEEMRAALEKMGSGLEIISYRESETEETLTYKNRKLKELIGDIKLNERIYRNVVSEKLMA